MVLNIMHIFRLAISIFNSNLFPILICLLSGYSFIPPSIIAAGKNPEVKVSISSASEISYPPFCVVDRDGQADGFSIELMRAALAAMDREVTFRIGTWNEARGWLEKGDVQALPLVGHTPEREFLYDFTFPYMSLHGAIVVRR